MMKRNRFISFFKTPRFILKEYIHRREYSGYKPNFLCKMSDVELALKIKELRKDGIVVLPEFFSGKKLQRLQSAFVESVKGKNNPHDPESLINTDFLCDDEVYLDAAVDSDLMQIVANYFGRPYALGRASAMRLGEVDVPRYGSYQWHHDSRGRQVHIMVLLNGVSSSGQKMQYLKGSNSNYYSHYRGLAEGSRFQSEMNEYDDTDNKIVDITGPPGTVAIFDSNGLHTGNRNNSEARDTLIFGYVSKRHFKELRYRSKDVYALTPDKRNIVTFNPYASIN